MSKSERLIRIIWDADLHISEGDEIEILHGLIDTINADNVYAFELRNITKGRNEIREISPKNIFAENPPEQFKPSIRGMVGQSFVSPSGTWFELKVSAQRGEISRLVNEAKVLLDQELAEECLNKKDAEDTITSAFRVLEERLRAKIGVGHEKCGNDLITDAFNPKNGKLILGKSAGEQEGLFFLYRGSVGFLRNPPAHRFVNYSEFEAFEIVIHVNLLLGLLDKCHTRNFQETAK